MEDRAKPKEKLIDGLSELRSKVAELSSQKDKIDVESAKAAKLNQILFDNMRCVVLLLRRDTRFSGCLCQRR